MKTALITGASGGIGSKIAQKLSEDGFFVLIHGYKNIDSIMELKQKLNSDKIKCADYFCDIANYMEVAKMFSEIELLYGGVDVLVNNAGISYIKPFTDISYNEWAEVIDTNLTGMFNTCHFAVPGMIRKKAVRL